MVNKDNFNNKIQIISKANGINSNSQTDLIKRNNSLHPRTHKSVDNSIRNNSKCKGSFRVIHNNSSKEFIIIHNNSSREDIMAINSNNISNRMDLILISNSHHSSPNRINHNRINLNRIKDNLIWLILLLL